MRLRRRRSEEQHPTESALAQSQRAAVAVAASAALTAEADRVERAVKALALHAEQLEDRLARLEARVATVERRALEAAPALALGNLSVVGAEMEAMAVAAEAAELKGELATGDGYVLADALAEQVAGLADSLDSLAATLASSTQTVPTLRALPDAS